MRQPWMIREDLAPGDAKSLERDWSDVTLHRIASAEDPAFEQAFGALWAEFGEADEVEQPAVLAERLRWDGSTLLHDCAFRYRLMLITSGGQFAAVRDHTAIVPHGKNAAFVHLSHVLVAPAWRRSGISGWLRALPIQTARSCLRAQNLPEDSPITLIGEMEHLDATNMATLIRLTAYEKAGYLKVDPTQVNYLQPDFRPVEEIEATGGPKPLRLTLIIRRVGREKETTISGGELRDMVDALYRMYQTSFRPQDMVPLFASLERYPERDAAIRLILPTTIPCP